MRSPPQPEPPCMPRPIDVPKDVSFFICSQCQQISKFTGVSNHHYKCRHCTHTHYASIWPANQVHDFGLVTQEKRDLTCSQCCIYAFHPIYICWRCEKSTPVHDIYRRNRGDCHHCGYRMDSSCVMSWERRLLRPWGSMGPGWRASPLIGLLVMDEPVLDEEAMRILSVPNGRGGTASRSDLEV